MTLTRIYLHRSWAIVIACFLASTIAVGGSQYSFGHFVEPLEKTFGWTRTQIGLSLSLIAFGSFVSPMIGILIDRYGSRKIMALSMAILGVSYLVRPLMSELWHWYVLSIVQSFSMVGAAMLPPGKLVGLWFTKNRGRILGIAAMGNNFGGMVLQPAMALIVKIYDWRMGYTVIGALGIAVSIYVWVVVRNPGQDNSVRPTTSEPGIESTGVTLSQALRTKNFYVVSIAILCGTFTYFSLLPQVSSHLINIGVGEAKTAFAVSLFATCGLAGKFIFGILADWLSPRLALIIDLLGQAIFACLLVYAGSQLPLWLIVPVMGFFLGAFGALYQLIVIDTFGVEHFGSIMGVISIANAVPAFTGPILAGISFDITGSYGPSFFVTACIFLIGAMTLKLLDTRKGSLPAP